MHKPTNHKRTVPVVVACPKGHLKTTRSLRYLCHGHRYETQAHRVEQLPGAPGKERASVPRSKPTAENSRQKRPASLTPVAFTLE